MSGSTMTNHAAIRMAQRGFAADDLTIIQIIGIEVEGGYFVRDKDCQELERTAMQMLARVRKLAGARVVISDNQIITAYRTGKSIERSLLRRAEDRELTLRGRDASKIGYTAPSRQPSPGVDS
jgi:hypothetical protein